MRSKSTERWALPALLLLAASCSSTPWARTPETTLKLDAPAKVRQGEMFSFRVEATTADGRRAPKLTYGWMIDWPDVKGMLHTGISFEPEQMLVKGGPGTATLRLYAIDAAGRRVQVHRSSFQVD